MTRPASAPPQGRLPVAARLGRSFDPALSGSRAWAGSTVARPGSASRVVASKCAGSRNLNRVPIGYALRPRLRGRLTQGGSPFPWKPRACGGRESHPPFATYACILSSAASSAPRGRAFPGLRNAPLPPALCARARGFGMALSPATLSAPGCSTSELLRTLSRGGCF